MYVCSYISKYACMYVYICRHVHQSVIPSVNLLIVHEFNSLRVYININIHMYLFMYICVYLCMYSCLYARKSMCTRLH